MNPYGFDWGPMSVTRVCHIEGRGYVLEIMTDHARLQLHITEKGRKIKAYPLEPHKRQPEPVYAFAPATDQHGDPMPGAFDD